MRKVLFCLLPLFFLVGCSQEIITFTISNKSDFDVKVKYEDMQYEVKKSQSINVDCTKFANWQIVDNEYVKMTSDCNCYEIKNNYTLYKLNVINHTNNVINFKIKNNYIKDFSVPSNSTTVFDIYTCYPDIETSHLNNTFSKNSGEMFLNFL